MIANRIRFAVIANENFGCTFAERNKEKECSMIHASDESMSRVKIEEGRGRGGGVRGGEIRTNRKGGGWRKGWLVSHAPRGRGENRFSLSAARIMARGRGLLHGNSIPWYEFSLVTLNREISAPPRSETPIVLRQSDRVIFPISLPLPFPPASCVWCTWSFCSLRVKKMEGKREIFKGLERFGVKVFTFE